MWNYQNKKWLGRMVYNCTPSIQEAESGNQELKTNLGYGVRSRQA
jgi:hypothetical protein